MSNGTSDRELVLTRVIDAPREKLYRAWTDPELLKQWFANATFSRVHVVRSVFTFVDDSTLLTVPDSVWSTSDSSRAAAGVTAQMIWFNCGDDSRSQRRLYVLLELSW